MTKCCSKFSSKLIPYKQQDKFLHTVLYEEMWRDFFIHAKDPLASQDDDDWLSAIYHCPFCGTKLPESLADKWFDVLEEEYGITDPNNTEYDKVPAEFRTDEWWKKRGL